MNLPHSPARPPCRRGFTLIELLVVIGIIGVLLAIVLPAIFSTNRSADRSRTRADLATVEMGLEEYKKDFKDYPRQLVTATERVKPLLGVALLGPTGTGFKAFRSTTDASVSGKIWGPYVPIEKFKLETVGTGTTIITTGGLLDRYDVPISYYPRWQDPRPGIRLFGDSGASPLSLPRIPTLYDWAAVNANDPSGYGAFYLRKALGDDNLDDTIGSGETLKDTPPFLLLCKGAKKKFTVELDTVNGKNKIMTQFEKCDEVANIPASQ